MKNTYKILNFIPIVLFLCWYLPTSFMNVYSCDDFWFGANVHNYGFWRTQIQYWLNWEGSFTHTFLASLPHIFNIEKIPFLCNIVSLIIFTLSLLFFIKTFFNLPSKKSIICSLYIVSTIYIFTIGNAEIRFWVCANLTYLTQLSSVIIFISLYHRINNKSIGKWIIPILLLLILIAGSKLTFINYALFGMILHDILFERKYCKNRSLIYITLIILTCINIAAPGNYIRLQEETSVHDIKDQMTLFEVILTRLKKASLHFIYALALFPISILSKDSAFSPNLNRKKCITIMIVAFTWFIMESSIIFICFRDAGPLRLYITSEFSIFIFMFYLLRQIYLLITTNKTVIAIALTFFSTILVLTNIHMILQVPPSIDFAKKSLQRNNLVKNINNETTIYMKTLPNSHLLLSYFVNDKVWLENVYLPYFGKSCKIELISSSDNLN